MHYIATLIACVVNVVLLDSTTHQVNKVCKLSHLILKASKLHYYILSI